jgi:hypothetical protein
LCTYFGYFLCMLHAQLSDIDGKELGWWDLSIFWYVIPCISWKPSHG